MPSQHKRLQNKPSILSVERYGEQNQLPDMRDKAKKLRANGQKLIL
jgi:hypothetical protein